MSREWVATAESDGTEVSVSSKRTGENDFQVTVGEREQSVNARQLGNGLWSVIDESGRQRLIHVERSGIDVVAVDHNGDVRFEVEDLRRKRLAEALGGEGAAEAGETLKAPIAGKVIKLLVEVGDEVVAGQGVIVLEAMKMENEIKASRGGKVTAIEVGPGDPVENRQKLLVLS